MKFSIIIVLLVVSIPSFAMEKGVLLKEIQEIKESLILRQTELVCRYGLTDEKFVLDRLYEGLWTYEESLMLKDKCKNFLKDLDKNL